MKNVFRSLFCIGLLLGLAAFASAADIDLDRQNKRQYVRCQPRENDCRSRRCQQND